MVKLEFDDLRFAERADSINVIFLKIHCFQIGKKELSQIGEFIVRNNAIEFPRASEAKARKRFRMLLNDGFTRLRNTATGKAAVYVHRNSGIPLIGSISFGIVDRNSTLIEVKPITGCNLKCVYCSVDQDRREVDFVVEKSYLVREIERLVRFKETDSIEVHMNSHGEPLYYAPLAGLIADISQIRGVSTVSMDTNGTMLTKSKVGELVDAGLTRFNISLNAIDPVVANKMAGNRYPLGAVKAACEYIAKRAQLLIAPVMVPGMNQNQMAPLIKFAKSLGARIGIQNFQNYRYGRNPVEAYPFQDFMRVMRLLERECKTKLIFDESDFNIRPTKALPKPFRRGDKVKAKTRCPGRFKNERIAAAQDRGITVTNCQREGEIRVKITRDKHNIFYGKPI